MTRNDREATPLPYGQAEAGLFDEDIVREVVQFIGEDTYRRLLDEFTQGLPDKLASLERLLQPPLAQDQGALRAAHQLKGAAQALGLTRLARSMSAITSPPAHGEAMEATRSGLADLREAIGLLLRSSPHTTPRDVS